MSALAGEDALRVEAAGGVVPTPDHLQELACDSGHRFLARHLLDTAFAVVVRTEKAIAPHEGEGDLVENRPCASSSTACDLGHAFVRAALSLASDVTRVGRDEFIAAVSAWPSRIPHNAG